MTRKLLITTTIFLILSACGQNLADIKKAEPSTLVSVDTIISIQDNLKIAKQFAEEFSPDTLSQNGRSKMSTFPDSVVKAFKALRLDPENQEKYLTLLFLKIYRAHLQCCYQSYELRLKPDGMGIDSVADPLLFEYNLITKQFDNNNRIEMVNSSIASIWVDKNKKLLSYDLLKEEYLIIKKNREKH